MFQKEDQSFLSIGPEILHGTSPSRGPPRLPGDKEIFYVLDQLPNKLVALYELSNKWTDLTGM